MTRPFALSLLFSTVLAAWGVADAAAEPDAAWRLAQRELTFGEQPDALASPTVDPGPESTTSPSDGDDPLEKAEELATPEGAAAVPTEGEASRLVGYNALQNPWLPIGGEEPEGWMPELPIPPACLDCKCNGKLPGKPCQVWRSFQRPTHPSIDQECVICVKEPCLGYKKVHDTTEAVVQKCFISEQDYTDKECSDGRCIETRGTKIVKQLSPCKTQVKLFYWKPVVEYRDVYYYINCEPCNEGDYAVAKRE